MEHVEKNAEFDELLDEIYEPFKMGDLTFYASDILYSCDPVAYRCGVSDWESENESEDPDSCSDCGAVYDNGCHCTDSEDSED